MNATMHLLTGTLLVLVGAVLALVFPDAEFAWFTGRPLGVVLVIVGVVDLAQGITERRKSGTPPTDR
ncbi:hypothetical protein [Aeromicrobium sp. Leaf350]|uniref:hypothetical protein n=1 Tax=Aeromicrobium sp. Leaf350 TaxID=2876565 RepID=UPI001E2A977E|nr:hypothetical protein [Aeromicrobium sp. Leaf350]